MTTVNSKKYNQEERRRLLFRARCVEYLDNGVAVSKIAKNLGSNYPHTKQICEQIRNEKDLGI